jgi:hypothetical protein
MNLIIAIQALLQRSTVEFAGIDDRYRTAANLLIEPQREITARTNGEQSAAICKRISGSGGPPITSY